MKSKTNSILFRNLVLKMDLHQLQLQDQLQDQHQLQDQLLDLHQHLDQHHHRMLMEVLVSVLK